MKEADKEPALKALASIPLGFKGNSTEIERLLAKNLVDTYVMGQELEGMLKAIRSEREAVLNAFENGSNMVAERIEARLDNHQEKISQSFEAQLTSAIDVAKKEVTNTTSKSKTDILKLTSRISSYKLFIYAGFFAFFTSVMSGFVIIAVNSYLGYQQEQAQAEAEAEAAQAKTTKKKKKKR